MDQKPTIMNEEWNNHLAKIDCILHRLNALEVRIESLEHPYEDYIEEYCQDAGSLKPS